MESYDTLVEAIESLRKQGYTEDMNLRKDSLSCKNGECILFHDEFHIDKFFRFDGNTDPGDEAILYAVSSDKHDVKGLLVNGYGISSVPLIDEMIEKLK